MPLACHSLVRSVLYEAFGNTGYYRQLRSKHSALNMLLTAECYQIKTAEELFAYLQTQRRNAIKDTDYQLQTNYGWVHELKNGKVAFFTNNFRHDAILFDSRKCFEEIVKIDRFPVDNPEQEIFDIERNRMKDFHLQADHYREHLNNVLKFDFPQITREAAQAYLKKVIGRTIKKLTTGTDILGLISVIGELVKAETNGKWFLEKRYGIYNPVYEPNMITSEGNVLLITSKVVGSVNWKTSKLENIFF